VSTRRDTALVDRLSGYASAVEVGVGRRPDVAAGLAAAGVSVTATDVVDRDVPEGVVFVRDDVVAASRRSHPGDAYDAGAVYGLNLPPELHRPTRTVARAVGADLLFTTLGGDPAAVPCTADPLRDGTTLYVDRAAERDGAGRRATR
jgi:uncharacterized UPF0146 family protein